MSEYRDSRIEETLRSIDNSLKRLTERFCEEERVDVAGIDKQSLINVIIECLDGYDNSKKYVWSTPDGKILNDRGSYAEYMATAILGWMNASRKYKPQSPYPD